LKQGNLDICSLRVCKSVMSPFGDDVNT
jgi:hypothetical protein